MPQAVNAAGKAICGPLADLFQERPFGGPPPALTQTPEVPLRDTQGGLHVRVSRPKALKIAPSALCSQPINPLRMDDQLLQPTVAAAAL